MAYADLGIRRLAALCAACLGCSSPEKLSGAGEPCLQVGDCQLGLVCVGLPDGTKVCSTDLSSLQHQLDAEEPVDVRKAVDGMISDVALAEGGPRTINDATQVSPDTGPTDASSAMAEVNPAPPDATAREAGSGSGPVDAASRDSGQEGAALAPEAGGD